MRNSSVKRYIRCIRYHRRSVFSLSSFEFYFDRAGTHPSRSHMPMSVIEFTLNLSSWPLRSEINYSSMYNVLCNILFIFHNTPNEEKHEFIYMTHICINITLFEWECRNQWSLIHFINLFNLFSPGLVDVYNMGNLH